LGGVSGLIGAGGNVGAVAAGFLNKAAGTPQQTLWFLGWIVLVISLCAIAVRFSAEKKSSEQQLLDAAIAERNALSAPGGIPVANA
jgi:NNP family nitrate/nitrite transporter-like MFS transporter